MCYGNVRFSSYHSTSEHHFLCQISSLIFYQFTFLVINDINFYINISICSIFQCHNSSSLFEKQFGLPESTPVNPTSVETVKHDTPVYIYWLSDVAPPIRAVPLWLMLCVNGTIQYWISSTRPLWAELPEDKFDG